MSPTPATLDAIEAPAVRARIQSVALGSRQVVGELEFACARGEHTVILGPNGAGKTTLLRALAGLVPFVGEVWVSGKRASELSRLERARRISYVPQRSPLSAALSVAEVVMQGRFAHQGQWTAPSSHDRQVVGTALDQADVAHLVKRKFTELSGGEQRRVLVARALATEAPVILLDEPTSFLDVSHALQLFELVRTLCARGGTLISVLHDLRDCERWADRALLLEAGQLRYAGAPQLPPSLVEAVYGVRVIANSAPSYELSRSR